MHRWMLDWTAAAAAGPEACGGKGWNLGRLHRFGFNVPAGGVMHADAYRALLTQPAVTAALNHLNAHLPAEATADPSALLRHPGVEAALAAVATAIRGAPLPDPARAELAWFLTTNGLEHAPLAVRSSATAEDGATASFAGIHRSTLGVCGLAAVEVAILDCYASLWTPQALVYRRRMGIADAETACAVVVCAMVTAPGAAEPICAGVAFTCDPRTGRRDQVVMNAAPGLGEALVSGRVTPEAVVVTLTAAKGLAVADRRTVGARATADSGAATTVLTDGQALALSRLALRVHWALGDGQDPQDVEWAYDDLRFWLLQARPVTRVPPATFPAVANLPVIWSNANLKDAVAGIQSTFGWSILQQGLRHILFAALAATRHPFPAGMETVRRFSGRAYFDLTALHWAFYDAFGVRPAELNRGLGGHQPELSLPPGSPFRGRRGWQRQMARLRLVQVMWRLGRSLGAELPRIHAAAAAFMEVDLAKLPDAELVPEVERIMFVQGPFSVRFQLANSGAALWPALLEDALLRVLPQRGRAVAAGLMAGTGQVTSAEHGYRLYALAAAAHADPAAAAYLAQAPLDPHGWERLPGASPFRREMAAFLAEFGHRGIYEVEIANRRWREDPTWVLDQVRTLLAAGTIAPPLAPARQRRQEAEAELAGCPFWARLPIRMLANQARRAGVLREAGKSAVVALFEPLRRITLELGRRMADGGVLAAADDIFHLSYVDAMCFALGEWDGIGARALVEHRRAQAAEWTRATPPDVISTGEAPPAVPRAAGPVPAAAAASRRLRGVGVAAGAATGPARLIRHPHEGGQLQPGEVLVAPSTDPGWTPLFLRAAAVVMETGGYLSHGAIVAREYGLPAVANVAGVMTALRNGQTITVDGDAGEVEVNS